MLRIDEIIGNEETTAFEGEPFLPNKTQKLLMEELLLSYWVFIFYYILVTDLDRNESEKKKQVNSFGGMFSFLLSSLVRGSASLI